MNNSNVIDFVSTFHARDSQFNWWVKSIIVPSEITLNNSDEFFHLHDIANCYK